MREHVMNILWGLLITIPLVASGIQWRYPVAALSDKKNLLLVAQNTQNNLELFLFNLESQETQKVLSSRYLPAGVRVLPDESSFSFIDDGILYIKRFERRAVHAIEPSEPLYGFEYIQWLDNETCYFHAHRNERIGIYSMNIDGTVTLLLENDHIDYLFPQIISGSLFYIARTHSIDASTQYSVGVVSSPNSPAQQIISFGSCPITLLHMVSSTQGFVLEHPATREEGAEQFPFSCYRLSLEDGCWQYSLLFTFTVPAKLLFDPQERLYESILPLIPLYGDKTIYYCSCLPGTTTLGIYCYSMESKTSKLCIQENRSLLIPYMINNMLVYGGEFEANDLDAMKVLQINNTY